MVRDRHRIIGGYFLNVIQLLTQSDDEVVALTVEVILRFVGIVVPPLGALMGWLGLFGIV